MNDFKQNLKELHTLFSTWVVFIVTTAAAFWITLPLETQNQILADFPILKYVVLGVAFVSFAIARAAPQKPKENPPQDKQSGRVNLPMLAVLLVMALATVSAHAAPPCWPKQIGGTGSDVKMGKTKDGTWYAWTCQTNGVRHIYGIVQLKGHKLQHPDVIEGLTPAQLAQAYWDANYEQLSGENAAKARRLNGWAVTAFNAAK